MSSPWKDFPNNKTEQPFEDIPAGQEPEVMPGFTAPETGPWPPLSREQVVALHEALVRFQHGWLKDLCKIHNPQDRVEFVYALAESLAKTLAGLQIGLLPIQKPRRWTNDDIQAAMEKHERELLGRLGVPKHFLGPGPSSATALALRSPMEARRTQGAWEEPTASLVSSPLGVKPCPLCKGSGQARSVQQINPDGSYEPKDAPLVNCMVCEGTGQISPGDEVQEEVKHNCRTCRNCNLPSSMACAIAAPGTQTRGWRDRLAVLSTSEQQLLDLLINSETPCPGWEPKP